MNFFYIFFNHHSKKKMFFFFNLALISISIDNTIKKWSVLDGDLISDIETKPGTEIYYTKFSICKNLIIIFFSFIIGKVCCGQYTKDGNYFATASQQGTIDLRKDSDLEEIIRTYTSEGKYGLCCRFVFFPF